MPGFQELLVIALAAVLVIGPKRLPKAAADLARLLARFRREANKAISDLKGQADVDGIGDELRLVRRELRDTGSLAKRALTDEVRALTDQRTTPHGPAAAADAAGEAADAAGEAADADDDDGPTRSVGTA